jgi:hypothetical protein
VDGTLTKANLPQALEMMQKEDPAKFEQFKQKYSEIQAGSVTLTIDQIIQMTRDGDSRMKEFDEGSERFVGESFARQIRMWRVDGHCTWRTVARRAYAASRLFGITRGAWWSPPSNELAGMSLCKRAAELLGENYREDPWN